MPGYTKGGPVLCFFRVDEYMSFGLTEKANISVEDGATDQLIESAWSLTTLDGIGSTTVPSHRAGKRRRG